MSCVFQTQRLDSSFEDQTTLRVNKNIFPAVIKARPVLLRSVNQDSITLSARLIPLMGPFQEAGPCFIDSIMKHLNIKRMPTFSQQVAQHRFEPISIYYGKEKLLLKEKKKKEKIRPTPNMNINPMTSYLNTLPVGM